MREQMGQLLSGIVLIGVCGAIGVRLLWLSRRTRGLPEFLIGISFLLAGACAGASGSRARSRRSAS